MTFEVPQSPSKINVKYAAARSPVFAGSLSSRKKAAPGVGIRASDRLSVDAARQEVHMSYVDGFLVPVPKDKIEAYKAMARLAGEVWKEHGALAFVECLADDVPFGELTSFPRAVQLKDDETVAFSWIVYESREARDAINAKVMADERLKADMASMPFDGKRMIFGGFKPIVEF
jgi:uncharacterized protein YbaA (DUF1428 family)